jgi:vacuolar-type H+-ATPase subunit E/Vma4|tara:strand:+ start:235 stop:486 length:252 start_codon:yes stop_codon:yes gene_type:complete
MEDRLSRVEKKIDTLQEAIVSLARVEERLVTVFNRQTNIEDKVNAIESKVDELTANMISSKLLERFIWVIVVASVGAIFTYMG